MEPRAGATVPQCRSAEMGFGLDEIHGIVAPPPESGCSSSFTALLELPPPQAVELLVLEDFPAKHHQPPPPPPPPPPIFPFDAELVNRASRFSVFASVHNSPESNSILPTSSPIYKPDEVKQEPLDSSPAVSIQSPQSGKRKERERKVKETNKKNKKGDANGASEADDQKLPYVHVRARRGQATDTHSLAERARREKINARMKLLQELVPGCNKISGTAMVLDEIINHVQGLQRQVEFLSMRLAAVDPKIDFNLNALLAAESGLSVANGCMGGISCQPVLPYEQINCGRLMQYQQPINNGSELHPPIWAIEEDNSNFMTPEPHF